MSRDPAPAPGLGPDSWPYLSTEQRLRRMDLLARLEQRRQEAAEPAAQPQVRPRPAKRVRPRVRAATPPLSRAELLLIDHAVAHPSSVTPDQARYLKRIIRDHRKASR